MRKIDEKDIKRAQAALAKAGILAGKRFTEHFLRHPGLARLHSESAKSGEKGHEEEGNDNAD